MWADEGGPVMIRLILVFGVVFLLATFPATWLLMLFLGNVGVLVGYWGTLPLASGTSGRSARRTASTSTSTRTATAASSRRSTTRSW
jgi:hypothetical protein